MVAAEAAGISERSARKWLGRWRAEGEAGLLDRSSAPKRIPHRRPETAVKAITALRRLRMAAAEIAEALGLALSTASLWRKRVGLGKRSRLQPPEPPNRYERSRPGELVHVDVKKLGRFGVAGKRVIGQRRSSRGYGWECCHVCVDDATRLAYVEALPDERGETAVGFLGRAVAWLAERGVTVERVMADNGSPYVSATHAAACRELGIRHLRTQPYRPRTNGKAERFIQAMLREWAYGRLYGSSAERRQQLPSWLDRYDYRRKHGSLGHRPPAARLNELLGNNLLGNYS
jgi:transposase InsO family protein